MIFGHRQVRAQRAEQGHVQRLLIWQLIRRDGIGRDEDAARTKHMPMRLHLGRLQHQQEIRFAAGHHRAEDLLAEPHVAGYRAAPLAHPFDLALLHLVVRAQCDIGQDVGAFEDALAAEAGNDDVGDFVHGGKCCVLRVA